MKAVSGKIDDKVFKQVIKSSHKDVSLESWLLKVFLEMDGVRSVDQVAKRAEMDMVDIRKAISKLIELGLISQVTPSESTLDSNFFEFLQMQLSLAVGPIAGLLIDEDVNDMGFNKNNFPTEHAAELVDSLAREIQREEKKTRFKLSMVKKIKEIKQ